jgi:hypothetical protein
VRDKQRNLVTDLYELAAEGWVSWRDDAKPTRRCYAKNNWSVVVYVNDGEDRLPKKPDKPSKTLIQKTNKDEAGQLIW